MKYFAMVDVESKLVTELATVDQEWNRHEPWTQAELSGIVHLINVEGKPGWWVMYSPDRGGRGVPQLGWRWEERINLFINPAAEPQNVFVPGAEDEAPVG